MKVQYVLDCSITMAWCFEDEGNEYTENALQSLNHGSAIVPTIWPLEVANVLLVARRKKRINDIQAVSFIDTLSILPIEVDSTTTARAMHSVFVLANQTDLTIYDAAYLELAIRQQLPLLTLDSSLIKAAKQFKISTSLEINK